MKTRLQDDLARDGIAASMSEKCPICGWPVSVCR
jgi:hypothetical protein